jgi:putative peptidoglycan lipid II flippase
VGLTTELLRILALLIVANSLISFLNAEHHCWRQYAIPAAAGVVGTLVALGYVALLHSRQGIHSVAWGLVAGAVSTVAILSPRWLWQLRLREVWQLRPRAAVQKCGTLLWPLLLGAICWRFDPLLDRYLGSYQSTGSIAHLSYAGRLATALSIIGISGLSIVAFPTMAAHAAAGRHDRLCAELAAAWRLLVVLLVPLAAGLALFSEPVAKLLFEDGRFGPADTRAVAWLIVWYLGMIVGTGLGDLLSRTMFALHDTRTPAVVGLLGFAFAAALKFWLAPRLGAAGLAAATSAFFVFQPAVLAAILLRRLGSPMLAGALASLVRSCGCAAAACLAAHLVGRLTTPFAVLPAAAAGALVYTALLWLAGDEFALRLSRSLFRLR